MGKEGGRWKRGRGKGRRGGRVKSPTYDSINRTVQLN